jgi:23S rRNA pseudouridine2605 synthase
LSSTQEFDETQLEAARATAWKQTGEPLLTLEAARDWINERGLVLFTPRGSQLPVPAPSLVEATLGVAKAAPTFAETEVARGLVARLVGEGLALPLNLLGVPGDAPDFVVSAQVFSFVFTMRGDKAWKQPPSTSGAVKVSPLGLKVYEVVTERGPVSAAEVAQELGREVTEAAILRSLTELWSQLRVIPLLAQGEGSTLWELTSRRFTKAIKAGANAGQPTALSALISLYLAQVFAATEEDVTTFLSPLTARSRVREVLHALVGARQLETVVVEGKTLLHIPGGLPVAAEGEAAVEGEEPAAVVVPQIPKKIGTGRIRSFASEGKGAGEFRGKPVAKSFGAKSFGAKRPGAGPVKPSARFGARLDGKTDKDRRPFKKDGAGAGAGPRAGAKKTFTKPWEEDRKPRAAAPVDGFTKFRRPAPEDRAPLAPREQAGLPVERRTPPRSATKSFEKRPYTPRTEEGGERATFKPRSYESKERAGGFGAKRPYMKRDAEGGAKPFAKRPYTPRGEGAEGSFAKRPYVKRDAEGGAKPFAKRPYPPRGEGAEGSFAKRPYVKRDAEGGAKPFAKRPYTPRTEEGGERASFKPRSFAGKEGGSTFPKRPYKPREGGTRPFVKKAYTPQVEASGGAESTVERSLPKRPYKPRAADAHTRPFTKEPWVPKADGDGAKRTFKPKSASYGRGGAGKSFGSKPGGKPKFGGKPGGAKPTFRKKPGA